MIELNIALVGVIALLVLGFYCIAVKRNMVMIVIGVEIMTNGAIMALVSFGAFNNGQIDPMMNSLAIMSITVAGCVAAVGLALVIQVYRHYKTLDVRELRRLRW
jgi:NADH-quinone oxidoreductase subunit K